MSDPEVKGNAKTDIDWGGRIKRMVTAQESQSGAGQLLGDYTSGNYVTTGSVTTTKTMPSWSYNGAALMGVTTSSSS